MCALAVALAAAGPTPARAAAIVQHAPFPSLLDDVDRLIAAGRYAEALARADNEERIAPADNRPALMARVELIRGAVWQARGFPRTAVTHFERALEESERSGGPVLVAEVYGALASSYGDLGQWDRALDFAERQREADPRRTPAEDFRYHFQRGVAFSEFHEGEQAKSSLQLALAAARSTADDRSISMALGELAAILLDVDHDVVNARSAYDEALETARRARLRDLEATWLLDSGAERRENGEYPEAKRRFEQALALERATGARRIRPAALKNLAQVLLHDGDRRGAEATLTAAQREADEQHLEDLRWEVRVERAVLAETDRPRDAERLFDEALDILEEAQSGVLVEQLRTGRLTHTLAMADPYALAIEFLLDRGETARAFAVAERGRARVFLETLRSAGDELVRALPPEYVELEATVLADISEGQAALRAGRPSGERRALEAAVRADEERLRQIRLRLATDRPDVFAIRYPRIWTAEELRRTVVKPHQALLMFFLGPNRSACWMVDARGLRVVRLPAEATIDAAARDYLALVKQPKSDAEQGGAASLFHLLLPGWSPPGDVDDLIVVADGILHDLPFETLIDASGQRLVERFALEYAPSASSFAFIAERTSSHRPFAGLLAVGNPLMTGRQQSATRDVTDVEAVGMLKPLPFTGVELHALVRLYGGSARLLEGRNATETALRHTDLSSFSIVHFATHGLIDERQPERSGLVLTAQPPSDDGILQVREVYGLRLRDALVTLSACDTALGANVRGEGINGLTRAFFYAGADAVVASLWSVNDRSTSEFMVEFYRALAAGASVAAALQQTKQHFLHRDGPFRAPYYWAAFIVVGEGGWRRTPTPLASANRTFAGLPLWVVSALVVSGLIFGSLIVWVGRMRWFRRSSRQTDRHDREL
jgi:CHAT domain-containing protein/tetratricopeptide (TPR) repeat protein